MGLLDILGGLSEAGTGYRKEEEEKRKANQAAILAMVKAGFVPDEFRRAQGALGNVAPPELDKGPAQQAIQGRQATRVPPKFAPSVGPLGKPSTLGIAPGQAGLGQARLGGPPVPPRPGIGTFQAPTGRGVPQRPPVGAGGLRAKPEGTIDLGRAIKGQRYFKRAPITAKEQASISISEKKLKQGEKKIKQEQERIAELIRAGKSEEAIKRMNAQTSRILAETGASREAGKQVSNYDATKAINEFLKTAPGKVKKNVQMDREAGKYSEVEIAQFYGVFGEREEK